MVAEPEGGEHDGPVFRQSMDPVLRRRRVVRPGDVHGHGVTQGAVVLAVVYREQEARVARAAAVGRGRECKPADGGRGHRLVLGHRLGGAAPVGRQRQRTGRRQAHDRHARQCITAIGIAEVEVGDTEGTGCVLVDGEGAVGRRRRVAHRGDVHGHGVTQGAVVLAVVHLESEARVARAVAVGRGRECKPADGGRGHRLVLGHRLGGAAPVGRQRQRTGRRQAHDRHARQRITAIGIAEVEVGGIEGMGCVLVDGEGAAGRRRRRVGLPDRTGPRKRIAGEAVHVAAVVGESHLDLDPLAQVAIPERVGGIGGAGDIGLGRTAHAVVVHMHPLIGEFGALQAVPIADPADVGRQCPADLRGAGDGRSAGRVVRLRRDIDGESVGFRAVVCAVEDFEGEVGVGGAMAVGARPVGQAAVIDVLARDIFNAGYGAIRSQRAGTRRSHHPKPLKLVVGILVDEREVRRLEGVGAAILQQDEGCVARRGRLIVRMRHHRRLGAGDRLGEPAVVGEGDPYLERPADVGQPNLVAAGRLSVNRRLAAAVHLEPLEAVGRAGDPVVVIDAGGRRGEGTAHRHRTGDGRSARGRVVGRARGGCG